MTLLLLAVLLPLVGGAVLPLFRFQQERPRSLYVEAVVLVTSALTWWAICLSPEGELPLLRMTDTLTLTLHLDGMSKVFAGLVSFLWPLASLYGFEYMRHENRPNAFFAYYTMSYGVTLAVALAGNLFSLYVFYECLTMVTLPLVTHKKDVQSIRAGRKYLIFSISGAALAFIALIFIMHYGVSTDFVLGGVLDMSKVAGHEVVLRLVFLLAFIGFGTKAAVFPMYAWLPAASVAPTPVTALLHAVAVVNAGAYAVIRVIYYSFGASFLYGSVAQIFAVCLACFTILFGSTMAVREQHFKRRLAYSTVSNLSYMLMGAALMTPGGMVGSLSHLIFHGLMKIGLFYCAGAVLVQTGKEYVQDLRGMGRVMPFTFTCFTIGSIAMVGIPPLCWHPPSAFLACRYGQLVGNCGHRHADYLGDPHGGVPVHGGFRGVVPSAGCQRRRPGGKEYRSRLADEAAPGAALRDGGALRRVLHSSGPVAAQRGRRAGAVRKGAFRCCCILCFALDPWFWRWCAMCSAASPSRAVT